MLLVRHFIKQPHHFQETFHRFWSAARYCPLLELCNKKFCEQTWCWKCKYTVEVSLAL